MDSPPTRTVLDYASPPPTSHGLRSLFASITACLGRFIRWLPQPVMAVFLTFPPLALYFAPWKFAWDWRGFYLQSFLLQLALFLPGAIHRWKWGQALIAGVFAAVALGEQTLLAGTMWPSNEFARSLLVCAIDVALLGICEMTLTRQLRYRKVVWISAVALGIAASVVGVAYLISFSDKRVFFKLSQSTVSLSMGTLMMPPFLVAIAWVAIPRALVLVNSTKHHKRIRVAVAASISLAVAAYVTFFSFVIYALADRSLNGHGPWHRMIAFGIFTVRGSDADLESIWRAVERSDWKTRLDDPKDRGDWRERIIKSLGKSRPGATAQRLSLMLRTHPSRLLSEYAAEPITREKRYDAVPALLRYALLPQHMRDLRIADALAEMGIPQAALPGINFWLVNSKQAIALTPDTWLGDDRFWGPGRETFETLLHAKAPPTRREAFDLFWQLESSSPTPLPESQRLEVARLMNCIRRYWDAWQGDVVAMAIQPDWDNAPIERLEQQVDECIREMQRLRAQAPAH